MSTWNQSNAAEKIKDGADAVADKAERTIEKVADKAERSVDSARTLANDALDKAENKVRSLREDVKPAIDALAARMQDMAERGKEIAAETTAQTRDKFNDVANRTSSYVQDQPMKSMAIAAAAGAVVAMLMGRRRR